MPFLNIALFLATLLTTTMQGALERHGFASMFPLQDGLAFSVPLMAILLCHEMGHYVAARWHHVPAVAAGHRLVRDHGRGDLAVADF
jgi:hypothetical protein